MRHFSKKHVVLFTFFILLGSPRLVPAATATVLTKNSVSTSATALSSGLTSMLKITEDSAQNKTSVSFKPVVRKTAVKINSKTYSRFLLRDSGYLEKTGYPRLPFISRFIAIPDGMTASVSVTASTPRTVTGVSVEPAPPLYEDNVDYVAPAIKENAKAYASSSLYPPLPYEFVETGRMRGVRIGVLRLYPLQYKASSKSLTVNDSMTVQIALNGVKTVVTRPIWTDAEFNLKPVFANPQLLTSLVTRYVPLEGVPYYPVDDTPPFDSPDPRVEYANVEFLILTHPDFKDAGDELAVWKNEKGIHTIVKDLNASGWTVAEIDAFVNQVYDWSSGTLQYLMILGDSDYVPTDYYQICADGDTTCTAFDIATDLPYAEFNGDIYPELAYGRLPANTLDEANAAVAKILSYEQNPPPETWYYNNMAFAGLFDDKGTDGGADVAYDGIDNRSFVETMETVRTALMTHGKAIDRIYTAGSSYLTTNPTGPQYYEDGVTPIPSDLLVQYDNTGTNVGFGWDGGTSDVTDDFNANMGLIFQRDHGGSAGWSSPSYNATDLSALTNTSFPVVFSISCLTGRYDHETGWWSQTVESFAEQALVLPGHGPASLIAGSRPTSTSRNNTMSKGLFDALWDDVVTDASHTDGTGADAPITRLGDILNYAKLYVALHHSDVTEHFHHYYVVGDPTLEVLRESPYLMFWTPPDWTSFFDAMNTGSEFRMSLSVSPRSLLSSTETTPVSPTVKLHIDPWHYLIGREILSTATPDGGVQKTYQFDASTLAGAKEWAEKIKAAPADYKVHATALAKGYRTARDFMQ